MIKVWIFITNGRHSIALQSVADRIKDDSEISLQCTHQHKRNASKDTSCWGSAVDFQTALTIAN
jgi:hypothetical protein